MWVMCDLNDVIAAQLQAGTLAQWETVAEAADLHTLPGGANRLFQLLVEGRHGMGKPQSLILGVDAFTYRAAGERSDLFTPKDFLRF